MLFPYLPFLSDRMSPVAALNPKHPDSYGSVILRQLADQQEKSELTDFVLSCQGQELHCHKAVLAAACPYFSAMFSSGLKEMEQGRAVMDTIEFPVLKWIVHYLYGNCSSISWDDVENFLDACELFQLNELKKRLEEYITENITAEISIRWWKLCEMFNLETAGAKAKSIMVSYFEEVSKSHDFTTLTYGELVDYIRNDEIKFPEQDQVLHAGIRWLSADLKERTKLMLDFLKLVQLNECSSESIENVTKTHSELFTDPEVKSFVYGVVLARLAGGEKKDDVQRDVLVLGGMSEYYGTCFTECWSARTNFTTDTWECITHIPKTATGTRSSYVRIPRGFAVICGGKCGTINSSYDIKKNAWTDLPPTPEKLTDTVALYMKRKIYVLDGGKYHPSAVTDKMLSLDLQTLQWSEGPTLLEKQYRPIATAYDQSLWVVYNDNVNKKSPCTLQMLSEEAKKWVYKANLPDKLDSSGSCLVGCKGNLYLIGGLCKVCVQYMIAKDQWCEMTAKPTGHHFYASGFKLDQKIILCGGGWCEPIDDISEYDPESDKWTISTNKLPKQMTYFTAA